MKILLHICCAPCSIYPIKKLKKEGFSVEGLFYNPNIHPLEEHKRRKDTLVHYSVLNDLKVHYMNDFEQQEWQCFDGNKDQRCNMCYKKRIKETVKKAKNENYDAFTTTLLVSSYQNHELIKHICSSYAEEYSIDFVYYDFRQGFRNGQKEARELNLYRQKYCGCIFSLKE
jgi:epoxyqueuosine reductase